MSQRTKASYTFKRTVATYGYLRSASWIAFFRATDPERLRKSAGGKQGRFYDLMGSMLFCALTLEAYLNHVGAIKVPGWSKLERKLGPREKLSHITKELGLRPNFNRRPFASFVEIFRLRDKLVHGKTITLVVNRDAYLAEDELPPPPLSKWERLINQSIAQRFLDDTKAIIIELNSAARLEKELLFTPAVHEVTLDRTSRRRLESAKPA